MSTDARQRALSISRFRKLRFLLNLSEDKFRDEVVRPLFLRQGLKDGRDVCGPTEKGKDAIFIHIDSLGMQDVYVLQTKKGHLNLAKKAAHNIVECATQLRTALSTQVTFSYPKHKQLPSKAILCASGQINDSAREHILSQLNDPRITFMDADDLIPKLDEALPELWFGIDTDVFPYLDKLKRHIEDNASDLSVLELLPGKPGGDAATDQMFVTLSLFRTVPKTVKVRGEVHTIPHIENIPIHGLINRKEKLFLVIGDAGSGKSTSLRRIAYILAQKGLEKGKDFVIPILLRATTIVQHLSSKLVEICGEETRTFMNSATPVFSQEDLLSFT